MRLSSLWSWIGRPSGSVRKTSRSPMRLEGLEDRAVPATLVGLTTSRDLVTFDSAAPTVVLNSVRINGVPATETLLGIDYRPATGLLYATTQKALYTVDPISGAAKMVDNYGPLKPGVVSTGFDFNPILDRIRFTNANQLNVRIEADTTGLIQEKNLTFQKGDTNAAKKPTIAGIAYTNPDNDPTTGSTLYGIDTTLNTLVKFVDPNAGILQTVGALGLDVSRFAGMDVGPDGVAYASLSTAAQPTVSKLYTLNVTSGAATLVGGIGSNLSVVDVAVVLSATPVYAVTTDNKLVTFNASTPEIITSTKAITGLAEMEQVQAIDFRPSTGELIATTNGNHVYALNLNTGAATKLTTNSITLPSSKMGTDIDPVADSLRVVGASSDENLRIASSGRGALTNDTKLSYATGDANVGKNPNVVGLAYSNNFSGATTTTLFAMDTTLNTLVRIGGADGTPNAAGGSISTVGALTVSPDATKFNGMDISAAGQAFAVMQLEGQSVSRFYKVNTSTGAATPINGVLASNDGSGANKGIIGSVVGSSPTIVDIAVAPPLVRFLRSEQRVAENAGTVKLLVVRTGDTSAPASVKYDFTPGTATTPANYTGTAGTVAFTAAQPFATFEVTIVNNTTREPSKSFKAVLSKETAAALTIDPTLNQTTTTILNDD